ncbi:MAG TPA: type II toxin-antitoxin system VapC family toxin [Thermoanaerobaculia bacterium]|nr:type II toxin-antitoxin system VapC family toxin [Thermoanaerobaculia bacterium]
MITAVDSSVLIDIFGADAKFGVPSANLMRRCLSQGALIACEVVWTETAVVFHRHEEFIEAMARLGVEFSPIEQKTTLTSARAWRRYLDGGGQRHRVVADFLVGAHALEQADRLMTRDRGFYRDYFAHLKVIDPAANTR